MGINPELLGPLPCKNIQTCKHVTNDITLALMHIFKLSKCAIDSDRTRSRHIPSTKRREYVRRMWLTSRSVSQLMLNMGSWTQVAIIALAMAWLAIARI